jgi:hypothetical protein
MQKLFNVYSTVEGRDLFQQVMGIDAEIEGGLLIFTDFDGNGDIFIKAAFKQWDSFEVDDDVSNYTRCVRRSNEPC